MDSWAADWISDGLGGDVNDVKWIGLTKARALHDADGAIWIDVREHEDRRGKGTIPGAWSVPMQAVSVVVAVSGGGAGDGNGDGADAGGDEEDQGTRRGSRHRPFAGRVCTPCLPLDLSHYYLITT